MVIVHPGGLLGAFFVCPITFPETPRSGVSDFHHGLQFRSLLLGSGIGAYMYPHTCITIQPTTQRCSRCFSFPHGSSEAVDCLQICHSLSKDRLSLPLLHSELPSGTSLWVVCFPRSRVNSRRISFPRKSRAALFAFLFICFRHK